MTKLINILENLAALDQDATIYAAKPWNCDSPAVVVREPEEGGIPREAREIGATYFLEVFVADEFLEDWRASNRRPVSDRDQCERLIMYAINDA